MFARPDKRIKMSIIDDYLDTLEKEEQMEGTWSEIGIIRKVHNALTLAKYQTYHDTLSDEFQIISEMQDVLWKYAKRRLENSL